MTSILDLGAIARRTGRRALTAALVVGAAMVAAQPALAQDHAEPGPYAVARAGVQLDTDLRFPASQGAVAKTSTTAARPAVPGRPAGFPRTVDGNAGFTGELGGGYDFGGFRLEGTVGYNSAAVNAKQLGDRTNVADGRLKSMDLGIAGYVDLNASGRLNPFVGGGIGASRVTADIKRQANATTPATPAARRPGTRFDDRDWGFRWHLDAGLGYKVAPGTTLELGGRYSRTTALDLRGRTISVTGTGAGANVATTNADYKPRLSSTSVMLGLRQKF